MLDLGLLSRRSLRFGMMVECNLRLLVASAPLLLALLLQTGLGLSASAAGLITLANSAGSLSAKGVIAPLYRRFGFRNAMAVAVVISATSFAALAGLGASYVWAGACLLLFIHGLSRSVVLSAAVVLAYDEIAPQEVGQAGSMISILQQMSMALGVGMTSTLLYLVAGDAPDLNGLRVVILVMSAAVALPLITLWRIPAASLGAMIHPR